MQTKSNRQKEIRRRRTRRKKIVKLHKRLKKATVSEKLMIAHKLRDMTPGAEVLIKNWGLIEQR